MAAAHDVRLRALEPTDFPYVIGFSARLDPDHDGPGVDRIVLERVLG